MVVSIPFHKTTNTTYTTLKWSKTKFKYVKVKLNRMLCELSPLQVILKFRFLNLGESSIGTLVFVIII